MKKYFTHLLALVACFLCSMNANAQFSAAFEQEPVGYTVIEKSFPMSEIATAMGVDAAELTSALNTWITSEEETATNYFFLNTADGLSSNYTQGGRGGFWMTKNPATPVGWTGEVGDDAWYNILSVDVEAQALVIGVGQHPDAFTAGEEVNATFVLQYNDKEATFEVSLKIIEGEVKPPVDLPDPVTDLTALNIVGTKNFELMQYPSNPMAQSIDLTGVAEALGTTEEIMADNIDKFIYMTTLELKGEDASSLRPYKTNTLSNESTANGVGFWMAAVWDDEIGGFTEEVVRSFYSTDPNDTAPEAEKAKYDSFRSMYAEGIAYDAETHKLSYNTGWNNLNQEYGTKFNYDLYVVYGDKAYKLHHVITFTERPTIDPTAWTEVASEDIELEFNYVAGAYTLGSFSIDQDAVLAALGCEASDIKLYGLEDAEGHFSDDYDAVDFRGFWLTAEGLVCKWAQGYFYAGPKAANNWTEWEIGQHPDKSENASGAVYTSQLFLTYEKKYYRINLKLTIKGEEPVNPGEVVPQDEWESVATWNINASTLPSDSVYPIEDEPAIDLDALEELIGTRTATLYGLKKTDDGQTYTKAYNCDPKPGFYLTSDGWVGSWGDGDPWAFSYLPDGNYSIRFFQYPGKNQLGDIRKSTVYLVNEKNGKMVTLNLTLIFGSPINAEEVGSADIMVPAADSFVDVDMTEALPKMGVNDVSYILGNNMRAMLEDGQWTDLMSSQDGCGIKANGGIDNSDDGSESVIFIYPAKGSDANTMTLEISKGNVALEPGKKIVSKIAFESEVAGEDEGETINKRFTINLTIVDEETFVGIDSVASQKVDSDKVFDLAGRRSDMSHKGVYIVNGKKVVK